MTGDIVHNKADAVSDGATTAVRATVSVREAILRGDYPAGSRLGEKDLAIRLDVSRTPVREALRQLAAEGLVDLTPNRGAVVASWSAVELDGVFEVRVTLEPVLTGVAATKATDENVAELEVLADRMVAVGTPGPDQDLEALVPLNRSFHDLLIEIADSPAIAAALAGAIRGRIARRNFHLFDEGSLMRSLAHHLEIVEAVRQRDQRWAHAVMTAHLQNARVVMLRNATP